MRWLTICGHDVKDNIGDIDQLPREKSMDERSDQPTNLISIGESEEVVKEIINEDLGWLGEVKMEI